MKTTSSLVKLIIFALVTLVTFGTLAATIANISFGDRFTYRAVFSDVTGLATGQDVRIAGVRVGEISTIAPAPSWTSPLIGAVC
jgi:phospholipid/cholesterol/gamma-HCH transport system substrate-binding protein